VREELVVRFEREARGFRARLHDCSEGRRGHPPVVDSLESKI
jgi:hypothetical protein